MWCRRSTSGGCRRSAASSSTSRSTRSRTSRIRRARAAARVSIPEFASPYGGDRAGRSAAAWPCPAVATCGRSWTPQGRTTMRKALVGFAHIAPALLALRSAPPPQTITTRLTLPHSGQFADPSAQMDNGITLYMKQHGDTVAGKKIELIRKDTGGIAPDIAKRLAQELIVRDSVDLLAGFALTPNALAAGDVSAQAKKF